MHQGCATPYVISARFRWLARHLAAYSGAREISRTMQP